MSTDLSALKTSLKSEFPTIWNNFKAEFPTILEDINRIIEDGHSGNISPDTMARLQLLFQYNVPAQQHDSFVGGALVPLLYNAIVREGPKEDQLLAIKLGWILHIIQASFYVRDDVIDGGSTRWNRDCWYLHQKSFHQQAVLNDVSLMEYSAYTLLMEYFQHDNSLFYVKTFLHCFLRCTLGQNMDMTAESKTRKGDQFEINMEEYRQMNYLRVGYPAFYIPACLSLHLSGVTKDKSPRLWDMVHTVTLEMGQLFQIQDDYLDVFGPGDKREKNGDIRSGKKSWLYLKAVEICNDSQRKILQDNYGIENFENVLKILELYEQLGLEEVFKTCEHEFVMRLQEYVAEIQKEPNGGGVAAAFLLIIDQMAHPESEGPTTWPSKHVSSTHTQLCEHRRHSRQLSYAMLWDLLILDAEYVGLKYMRRDLKLDSN